MIVKKKVGSSIKTTTTTTTMTTKIIVLSFRSGTKKVTFFVSKQNLYRNNSKCIKKKTPVITVSITKRSQYHQKQKQKENILPYLSPL
jgi:hypothetical protein